MIAGIADFINSNEILCICIAAVIAVIFIAMLVIVIVSMVKLSKLQKKYDNFMADDDGKSLESVIDKHLKEIDSLLVNTRKNAHDIEKLYDQISYAFQKLGMVKYDAFDEMGGKLSFTLALLNERDDGFVMNAVHSREGCYTYIKDVIGGKAVIQLSAEEKEALDMALKGELAYHGRDEEKENLA